MPRKTSRPDQDEDADPELQRVAGRRPSLTVISRSPARNAWTAGWRSGGSRRGGPSVGELPVDQDGHPVGHQLGELEVVGHHDGGVAHAACAARAISSATSRALVGSRPAVGSSKKHHLRLARSGRARCPRACACRPTARRAAGRRAPRASPTRTRKRCDAVGDLGLAQAGVLAQRIGHVLEDGQRVEERGALEHEAHAAADGQQRLLAQRRRSACRRRGPRPRSGRIRPAAMRRSTVLPEPLPPMTASVVALRRGVEATRRAAPRGPRTTCADRLASTTAPVSATIGGRGCRALPAITRTASGRAW